MAVADAPQTWHYGLVARWWGEFNTDGPEIDYFRRFIERFGEPALDVACGAGRLPFPTAAPASTWTAPTSLPT